MEIQGRSVSYRFGMALAKVAQARIELSQLNQTNQLPDNFKQAVADAENHLREMLIPLGKIEQFLMASPTFSTTGAGNGR